MSHAINQPNATIYFKPVVTINQHWPPHNPHIDPAIVWRCRVMPKTIKVWLEGGGLKQVKRDLQGTTFVPCSKLRPMTGNRVGTLVMDGYVTPVLERLVPTQATFIHEIIAHTFDQQTYTHVKPTASLDPACVSADGTPITVRKEENMGGRYIKRWLTTYTTGTLLIKEVNIGDGEWFAIDRGTRSRRGYYYDDPYICSRPLPGRFSANENHGSTLDPWVVSALIPETPHQTAERQQREARLAQAVVARAMAVELGGVWMGGGVVAVPVAPVAPVVPGAPWRPSADAVRTALTMADRRVMPQHIKDIVVASAKDEEWECQVCFDSHPASKDGLTDCGHHVCATCVKTVSANALQAREPVWRCPTCRCPHAHHD